MVTSVVLFFIILCKNTPAIMTVIFFNKVIDLLR